MANMRDIAQKVKEAARNAKKLSEYVAPNGLYYEQNDIDYLVNHGYSLEAALAALADSEKYKTPVSGGRVAGGTGEKESGRKESASSGRTGSSGSGKTGKGSTASNLAKAAVAGGRAGRPGKGMGRAAKIAGCMALGGAAGAAASRAYAS
ncbi:MAG: hypothetical protein IKO94_00810, partial [Selenomonadaceae bacterium]|nr:hypothetical protein [Selenomonadaceae bacterium]